MSLVSTLPGGRGGRVVRPVAFVPTLVLRRLVKASLAGTPSWLLLNRSQAQRVLQQVQLAVGRERHGVFLRCAARTSPRRNRFAASSRLAILVGCWAISKKPRT